MVQKTEETISDCSSDLISPRSENVDEVSSAIVSEDEDSQSTRVETGSSITESKFEQLERREDKERGSDLWKRDEVFFFPFVTFRVCVSMALIRFLA